MNFKAFLDSLSIMGMGMAAILGLMLIVWLMIATIRKLSK